jgi:hypothetical protein
LLERDGGNANDTTVVIVLEYEGVAHRRLTDLGVSGGDLSDILDSPCSVARHRPIFSLWRPTLADPEDDRVLELADDAGAPVIVTFSVRDFIGADRFGVRAITPREYLQEIGDLP